MLGHEFIKDALDANRLERWRNTNSKAVGRCLILDKQCHEASAIDQAVFGEVHSPYIVRLLGYRVDPVLTTNLLATLAPLGSVSSLPVDASQARERHDHALPAQPAVDQAYAPRRMCCNHAGYGLLQRRITLRHTIGIRQQGSRERQQLAGPSLA